MKSYQLVVFEKHVGDYRAAVAFADADPALVAELSAKGRSFKSATSTDDLKQILTTPDIILLAGPGSSGAEHVQAAEAGFEAVACVSTQMVRKEIASESRTGAILESLTRDGVTLPAEAYINLLQKACARHSCGATVGPLILSGFPSSPSDYAALKAAKLSLSQSYKVSAAAPVDNAEAEAALATEKESLDAANKTAAKTDLSELEKKTADAKVSAAETR